MHLSKWCVKRNYYYYYYSLNWWYYIYKRLYCIHKVILILDIEILIFLNMSFKKYFIYLFIERREGRQKDKGRNINVWLPLVCPLPWENWPATQACALTALNPLSHTGQGEIFKFTYYCMSQDPCKYFPQGQSLLFLCVVLKHGSIFTLEWSKLWIICDIRAK